MVDRTSRARAVVIFVCLVLCAAPGLAADAPDLPDANVVIPWSDFKPLLDKLSQTGPAVEPPPPFAATIGAATYRATVGADVVVVEVAAEVVVLDSQGWVALPVIPNGNPLAGVTLDGKPAALTPGDDGLLRLALRGAGAHALTLQLRLPLRRDNGPAQFDLPAILAAVHRLEVTIPDADAVVTANPGGVLESRSAAAGTTAVGAFPATGRVTVSWTRRAPRATAQEARVSAEVRTMLSVGEGLGVYTAIVDYEIQHQSVAEFALRLPAGVNVADVSTEGLVDWRVTDTEGGQDLRVRLAFEAIGHHVIAITYEQNLGADPAVTFTTIVPQALDVVHEVGYLAVAGRTNVQVSPRDGSLHGLTPQDPEQLPPDLRGSDDQRVLYGYKYITHPASVDLEVTRHKDASVLTCEVELARYRIMLTGDGKELIEGRFRIVNRSRQYLTLTLPPGTDLWGVYRGGEPVRAAESDGKILLPIFEGGLRETFDMKIIAYRNAGRLHVLGHRSLALPTLDVGVSRTQLELYLPYRYAFHGFGGALRPAGIESPAVDDWSVDTSINKDARDKYPIGGELDRNIQYRRDQSVVQSQTVNLPVATENAGWEGTMTRGALPVDVDVTWEGQSYGFAKTIADPDEKLAVTFFYNRRVESGLLALVVAILAGAVGYFLVRRYFPRPNAAPDRRDLHRAGLAVVLLALPALLMDTGGAALVTWLVIGAAVGAVSRIVPWFRKPKSDPAGGAQ